MDFFSYLPTPSDVVSKTLASVLSVLIVGAGTGLMVWLRSKNWRVVGLALCLLSVWIGLYIIFRSFPAETALSFAMWLFLIVGGALALFAFLDWKLGRSTVALSAIQVPVPPLLMTSNEIIYPPLPDKNAALWEWDGTKMAGPFCPLHREKLILWIGNNPAGKKTTGYGENDNLNGNVCFACPRDDEEFIFIRLGVTNIRDLRARAMLYFEKDQQKKKIGNL